MGTIRGRDNEYEDVLSRKVREDAEKDREAREKAEQGRLARIEQTKGNTTPGPSPEAGPTGTIYRFNKPEDALDFAEAKLERQRKDEADLGQAAATNEPTDRKTGNGPRSTLRQIIAERHLEAALAYARLELPVLPIWWLQPDGTCACNDPKCDSPGKHPIGLLTPKGLKDATTDPDMIRQWWHKYPNANIAIPTGKVSGVVALDDDPRNGGDESLRQLLDERGDLPKTVEAITGSGGLHSIFQYPEGGVPSRKGLRPGLDLKSDGGYIVVAPSLHASGNRYMWSLNLDAEVDAPSGVLVAPGDDDLLSPWNIAAAKMPEWLIEIAREKKAQQRKVWTRDDRRIPQGIRDDMLTSLAGTMRMRDMSDDAILEALLKENDLRCDPPLDRGQVEKIVRSVGQYAPGFQLTELGNAKRLIYRHGADLRFVKQLGKWFIWDGTRWRKDETGEIYVRAKGTVETLVAEAANADERGRDAMLKWYKASQRESAIRNMVKLAETEPDVMAHPREFDQDPWLLNVQNGTIDLQTGTLREHRREDLITKVAPVKYDAEAQVLLWQAFLEKVLPDPEVRAFLQRAVGYALTGDTREEVLFIPYGSGRNGKSTFIGTVTHLLGPEYAANTPAETFLVKRQEGIRNDVARLDGARLVTTIETDGGRRLAESLVKSITGRDKVTARFLHHEYFDFEPQFKLFLVVNHKPLIRGEDYAIWERITLIPFDVTIPLEERDDTLKDALREPAELSGILNWALLGLRDWQQGGLQAPPAVRAATEEYRDEMDNADSVRAFLRERCEPWSGATTTAVLLEAYTEWCKSEGIPAVDSSVFGRALGGAGYKPAKIGKSRTRGWHGLRLKPATDGAKSAREAAA